MKLFVLILFVSFSIGCSDKPDSTVTHKEAEPETTRLTMAQERLETMGPEFLAAVKSFAPNSSRHGVSVLAHEHNLFLIALDLEGEHGPYVEVMFASVFIEDGHSYWRLYRYVDQDKDLLPLFGPERQAVE